MVNGSLREMWLKEEWRSTTKRNGIRNRIRIWMFIYSRRHHHQCSFHMIVHTECNFDSHAKQQSKNNFKYLLFLAFLSIYFIMSLRSRLKMSASLSWFVRSSYLSLSLSLSCLRTSNHAIVRHGCDDGIETPQFICVLSANEKRNGTTYSVHLIYFSWRFFFLIFGWYLMRHRTQQLIPSKCKLQSWIYLPPQLQVWCSHSHFPTRYIYTRTEMVIIIWLMSPVPWWKYLLTTGRNQTLLRTKDKYE